MVNTRIVVEFDALYDLAFGVIKYIKNYANDVNVFDQNVINANGITLLNMLHSRRDYNPLYTALKEEYTSDAEEVQNLYDDIMKNRYKEVLQNSIKTDIFGLIKLYCSVDWLASIDILCNKSIEEQFISEIIDSCNIIYTGFETDINEYDVLIVNDYTNVLKYYMNNPIRGKEIILFDNTYNMEPDRDDGMPLMKVSGFVSDVNRIKTICPYAKFQPAKG